MQNSLVKKVVNVEVKMRLKKHRFFALIIAVFRLDQKRIFFSVKNKETLRLNSKENKQKKKGLPTML